MLSVDTLSATCKPYFQTLKTGHIWAQKWTLYFICSLPLRLNEQKNANFWTFNWYFSLKWNSLNRLNFGQHFIKLN